MKWPVVLAAMSACVILSVAATLIVVRAQPDLVATQALRGPPGPAGQTGPAGPPGPRGAAGKTPEPAVAATPRADPSYDGRYSFEPTTAADKTIERWCDRLYAESTDDSLALELYHACPGQ